MPFLVAYDIADPSRLRRVARCIEKQAIRCQKSVFLFDGPPQAVAALLRQLGKIIDEEADVVQAWRLSRDESPLGRHIGNPVNIAPACLVLGPASKNSHPSHDEPYS